MEHRLLSLVRRAAGARSDTELLSAITDHAAFAELVSRHGPMVWGVCRNTLGDADAEDAFQATFLALLRSTIRDGTVLAAWLHGVAVRTSLAARREAGRRRSRERVAAAPETGPTPEPDDWAETMAIVHREVERLPEADRAAFVLCVLEGLTQADAADRLGRTPGTVAGQVTRAKKRLVARLTRRGVVPGLAGLGTASVAGAVPPPLVARVIDHHGSAAPRVLRLAQGALGMSTARAKLLAVTLVGIASAVGAWVATAGPPGPPDAPAPTAAVPEKLPIGAALARDWPMGGRSGDRNPVSPERNAPTEWQVPFDGKKAKNVKWSAKLGNRAHGGPVISGGLIWVGTNNQTADDKLPDFAVLACVRESDGKVLSRYLSPRRGKDRTHDWPEQALTGSPLVEGDTLWFCTNRREVVCLDVGPLKKGTGDSRELWKFDMVQDLKINPRPLMFPGPDFLGSPAAYKNFLFVATGNGTAEDFRTVPSPEAPALVCLRKDTGKVVWSDNSVGKNMLASHSASPLVIEIGGRAQVIHSQADGWVRSFDAETGKLVWKFDCNTVAAKGDRGLGPPGKRVYVLGTPVSAGGKVYFGTGTHPEVINSDPGRLFCVDPTKTGDVSPEVDDGTGKGKKNPNSAVVWEYTRDNAKDGFHFLLASVAVHDGLVYATDFEGYLHRVDAKTGERHWFHDLKGRVWGHPLVADGNVYAATDEGDVWVFAAGKTKKLIARNEVNDGIMSPPVFANGVLYVMTHKHLHAVAAPAK